MKPVVIVHGGAGPRRPGGKGEIAMPCIDMGMSHAWRSGDDPVRSAV